MFAVQYKIQQLLLCQQTFNHRCLSNRGPFILTNHNNIYKCDPVFDKIQRVMKTNKIQSVMSWNIQQLFWHCYEGGKICNIIKYLIQNDYDVICLQEVFELSTINGIISNIDIQSKYPHFLTGTMYNSFLIGENSGLLILSKYPIIFEQFVPFHKTAWPDSMASKGALYFSICNTHFITTHLQSGDEAIAYKQLKYILQKSPFTDKTILLGDLNVENPYDITQTICNNSKYTHNSKCILDHIINLHNDIKLSIHIDYFEMKQCTDHYPIIAEL